MTPWTIPTPDPLAQPGPTWLLWALLLLTFALHLLAMNLLLGGAIIGALTRRPEGPDGTHVALFLGRLRRALPVVVAATVTFGVAPLLFLQTLYGRLFFASSVAMAWFWLLVIPILILAYYGTYVLSYRGERLRGGTARALLAGVALLLLAISFIYVNNMSLVLRPDTVRQLYEQSGAGFQLNVADPTFVPRWLHFVLSALAVAGVGIVALGLAARRKEPAFGVWAIRRGANWCAAATALNLIPGFWWLLALPRPTLLEFMSHNPVATVVIFLGVTAGLVTMILAVIAARATEPVKPAVATLASLLVTVVCMLVTRDQVRESALAMADFQPTPWVAPQWGPIVLFVVLLVGAVGTVAWMVSALARGRTAQT